MPAKKTTTKKPAVKATKTAKAKTPKAEAPAKATKTKKAKSDGKLSALDAAAKVLADAGEPMNTKAMNTKAMIEAMAAKNLWTSPGGATPWATLCSAIAREISEKGANARFVKTGRGKFTAKK
jgi:hypothetical protein